MEIAAEVYGPEPKGIHSPRSELRDEELIERYKSLLGFELKWDTQLVTIGTGYLGELPERLAGYCLAKIGYKHCANEHSGWKDDLPRLNMLFRNAIAAIEAATPW